MVDRKIKVKTETEYTVSGLKKDLIGFISGNNCSDEILSEMASVMMSSHVPHTMHSQEIPPISRRKYGKRFPLRHKKWTAADDEYLRQNWMAEGCGKPFNEIAKNNDAVRRHLGRTKPSLYTRISNLKLGKIKDQ